MTFVLLDVNMIEKNKYFAERRMYIMNKVRQKKIKKVYVIFGGLLILQLINLFIWAWMKEGYFIDELWSYGLANSYYEPFLHEMEGFMGNWHSPSYYQSYLTVDEGEAFKYLSVYHNQVQDVHPPMYYFLIHTICSFWPGVFSKWFGLVLNLAFAIGSMWILLKIGQVLFGNDSISCVIPVLLYGFSIGMMNTALYIRMYMMLVFFALMFVYLSLLWWKKSSGYPLLLALSFVTLGGFLTQYFFIVFIFFVSLLMVLWQMFHGKWKEAIQYGAAVGSGLIIAVCIFPASISHMFQGYAGKEALSQATGTIGQYKKQLIEYAKVVSKDILGFDRLWKTLLIMLLVAFMVAAVSLIVEWRKKHYHSRWFPFAVITSGVVGYFFVVMKLVSGVASRYQFIVYPFFFLAVLYPVWYLCKCIKLRWLIWCISIIGVVVFGTQYSNGIYYIYPDNESKLEDFAQKYGAIPGYYFTEKNYDYIVTNDCIVLQKQANTCVVDVADKKKMQKLAEEQPDVIVVYLNAFLEDTMLEEVMTIWNYSTSEKVLATDYASIFVLYK